MTKPPLYRLLAGSVLLLATACSNNVTRLENTTATGDAFSQSLASEYNKLAQYEARKMVDWPDADRFAIKGLAAARGAHVRPERPEDWRTPEQVLPALKTGHRRLAAILETGARGSEPATSARAQARFDCWVEQQEENWQADHIAACRSAFRKALADLENSPEVQAARFTMLLFPFDSAQIIKPEMQTMSDLITIASGLGFSAIEVAGYTDRKGSGKYNLQLSRARAEAVRLSLMQHGVPGNRIDVSAWGESRPRVMTADDVREPLNRRVEIWLRKPEDLAAKSTSGIFRIAKN